MKILNPAYAEPIPAKQTKIRTVLTAQMAALPAAQRALSFPDLRAAIDAAYPGLNYDQGDMHQAAVDLGFAVAGD
jgi:hypothetical protein